MLNVVRCAIIYIIRCDELGCPDDGMLVVGGPCLLSIGAMVVFGIPMRKSDNRKVDDSALWRTPNPAATLKELRFLSPGLRASPATLGNGNKKRSNAVSVAFSEALLADAGHNRPTIFDAKANHNTYSVANICRKNLKPNRGRHPNHLKNSKNELPPPGEGRGGARLYPYPPITSLPSP